MTRYGELAAFGTALCWTASALFFERASKRIGALAVNFYKVVVAFTLLTVAGAIMRGSPLPLDAPREAWLYLPLSGLIGFVVADYFLFNAYILIGSRLTVLFQPLSPLFAALFSFFLIGERMRPAAILAMFVVISGILVTVLARNLGGGASPIDRGAWRGWLKADALAKGQGKGLVFALLSVLFNAVGLVLSKKGLGGYNAIGGTQIRTATAIVGFLIQALLFRRSGELFREAPRDRAAMRTTALGAVFGPFAGVTLSLFALQSTSAGAASTLMGLTPVLIIPPSILILKQKVKPLEALGAAIAVGGAALFFLV